MSLTERGPESDLVLLPPLLRSGGKSTAGTYAGAARLMVHTLDCRCCCADGTLLLLLLLLLQKYWVLSLSTDEREAPIIVPEVLVHLSTSSQHNAPVA